MENQFKPPIQPISSPLNQYPQSHNWQKIFLYILVELLVIAISGAIGFKIGKDQNSDSQTYVSQSIITLAPTKTIPTVIPLASTPTTEPPVTWKTFNDSINNVSFQYPSNAHIITKDAIAEVEFDQDPLCPTNSGAYGCAWFVRIYLPIPNEDHKSIHEYIKEKFSGPSAEKYSVTDTKIAGLNAIDVKILSPGASPAKMYYIQRTNDILFINAGVFGKTSEYQKIVDKLLSTLSLE